MFLDLLPQSNILPNNKFDLAQPKVGKQVDKLNIYNESQVIIGANRLIFNARKDELILVSKKDVKIATPA